MKGNPSGGYFIMAMILLIIPAASVSWQLAMVIAAGGLMLSAGFARGSGVK